MAAQDEFTAFQSALEGNRGAHDLEAAAGRGHRVVARKWIAGFHDQLCAAGRGRFKPGDIAIDPSLIERIGIGRTRPGPRL